MDTAQMSSSGNTWKRSIVTTTLICLAIAVVTWTIWSGSYLLNVAISLSFGYSSILSSLLLHRWFPSIPSRINSLFSLVIAICIGTVSAHLLLSASYTDYQAKTSLISVFILGLLFTVGCFTYFYVHEQKLLAEAELEKSKRKESEAEKALLLAKLGQLQSQIEPHFLFNTLANISALIEADSSKAQQMLSQLTDLLRATLKAGRESMTSIEQETAMISAYLGIQQIRLGERLNYTISCDHSIKSMSVPPLLIQPLVENAIVHGIEPKAQPGTLNLSLKCDGKMMIVTVSDTGVGLTATNTSTGHGMGLDNIRSRLNMLFNGEASLSLKEHANGGTEAQLLLPIAGLKQLKEQRDELNANSSNS